MESNKEAEKNGKTAESPKENSENTSSIFSFVEINNIVKAFVSAYLRGDIFIEFKSADEYLKEAQFSKQKITINEAIDREIAGKRPFIADVAICAGTKKATPEERTNAVCGLFDVIVRTRSAGRLKGNFMLFDPEKRLDKLEEGLAETNKLMQEVVFYLRSRDANLPNMGS